MYIMWPIQLLMRSKTKPENDFLVGLNIPYLMIQGIAILEQREDCATISPYISGGLFGGETDMYGLQIKGTHHTPLIGGMVFTTRVQAESVDTFGEMLLYYL